MKVVEADGYVNEYMPVENKYQSQKDIIEVILQKKKEEDVAYTKNKDGKGDAFYADMKAKLLNDPAYYQSVRDRYIKISNVSPSGRYVSQNRGTSYLTKKGNGFVRENEIGQIESYNEKGFMVKIEDRNGNSLRFTYDSLSRLNRVYDDCSNHIEISYSANNKIIGIQDSFQRKLRYSYDDKLRLISFTGLDQMTMKYDYDAFNRMTSITFADGSNTIISYTKNGLVSSQKGPGTKSSTFEYGKSGNESWTKVTEQGQKTTEYRYMDIENKIMVKEPSGKTTTTVLSSCCGKPISIKSSDGINDIFEYDASGNLSSRTNAAGQKTSFKYEPRFQAISDIEESSGKTFRYRYDRKGNLVFAQMIEGTRKEFLKIDYEEHGKIRHMIDHLGTEIFFTYSTLGKHQSIVKKANNQIKAQVTFAYDALGQSTGTTFIPNTPTTPTEIQTTLQSFMTMLELTGIDFEL